MENKALAADRLSPTTKRAIFALLRLPIGFLGRNVYLRILSFARNFSLQELVLRLPTLIKCVTDCGGKQRTNLQFCWRVKKEKRGGSYI